MEKGVGIAVEFSWFVFYQKLPYTENIAIERAGFLKQRGDFPRKLFFGICKHTVGYVPDVLDFIQGKGFGGIEDSCREGELDF